MRRKNVLLWLLVASLSMVLAACGDDDPPAKAKISFPKTEAKVTESDGTLKSFHPEIGQQSGFGATTGIPVKFTIDFDKPLADKTIIAYKLTGSASSITTSSELNDYALATSGTGYTLDDDNITIDKGVQSIEIVVNVYEDYDFETEDAKYDEASDSYIETAIFTLKSVVSGPVDLDISAQPAYTLSISEDDLLIALRWDVNGIEDKELNPGDVDMDLTIWEGGEIFAEFATVGTRFESVAFPGGFADTKFDLGYTFYSGTTPVDAYVLFANFGGTLAGTTDVIREYKGHYELDNINAYTAENDNRQVAQSITKVKLNYPTITELKVPETGSRVNTSFMPARNTFGKLRETLRNIQNVNVIRSRELKPIR